MWWWGGVELKPEVFGYLQIVCSPLRLQEVKEETVDYCE